MSINLFQLDKQLKSFLIVYTIVITIGMCSGLLYLYSKTSYSGSQTVEMYNGSGIDTNDDNDMEYEESYPKSFHEMIMTTHNHVLGMSFVYFSIGLIFAFNSIVKGRLKAFLMVEPLISIVITFGSLWLVRYVDQNYIYLTMISAFLMYMSFFAMAFINIYELAFKK